MAIAAWRGSIAPAAGDLIERVDRERRRAVGGRQQIGVDAQRRARRQVRGAEILVDAMRPDDLLGRRHPLGRGDGSGQSTDGRVITDLRNSRRPTSKMPPLRRISSSLGDSGTGCVGLVLGHVAQLRASRGRT